MLLSNIKQHSLFGIPYFCKLCESFWFVEFSQRHFKHTSISSSYPESVLHFEDGAVVDGRLHVVRDVDELCDLLAAGGRDGRPHLFDQIRRMKSSLASCKEALFNIHTELWPDFSRGVVLNGCKNLYAFTCKSKRFENK